jgi:hypothetical protein
VCIFEGKRESLKGGLESYLVRLNAAQQKVKELNTEFIKV